MLIVHDDNNNKCAARFKASFRTKWFDIIANCTLQCHVSYILWKQQMRCPFESVLPKPMIPNDRKLVRCSAMLVIYYDSNKCVARLKASFWTKWFAIIANLSFWCHVNYLINYHDNNKCTARFSASFRTQWFAFIAQSHFECHVNDTKLSQTYHFSAINYDSIKCATRF